MNSLTLLTVILRCHKFQLNPKLHYGGGGQEIQMHHADHNVIIELLPLIVENKGASRIDRSFCTRIAWLISAENVSSTLPVLLLHGFYDADSHIIFLIGDEYHAIFDL